MSSVAINIPDAGTYSVASDIPSLIPLSESTSTLAIDIPDAGTFIPHKNSKSFDYHIDLYHGPENITITGAEKVPLLTLIWMRKLKSSENKCKICWMMCSCNCLEITFELFLRVILSIVYILARVLVPIWLFKATGRNLNDFIDPVPNWYEDETFEYVADNGYNDLNLLNTGSDFITYA